MYVEYVLCCFLTQCYCNSVVYSTDTIDAVFIYFGIHLVLQGSVLQRIVRYHTHAMTWVYSIVLLEPCWLKTQKYTVLWHKSSLKMTILSSYSSSFHFKHVVSADEIKSYRFEMINYHFISKCLDRFVDLWERDLQVWNAVCKESAFLDTTHKNTMCFEVGSGDNDLVTWTAY